MRNLILSATTAAAAVLLAGPGAIAQTYSNAVMGLSPVGYWPLNETVAPPQPLNLTANNLGSLGAVGNGYYGAWYQPSGNTWYLTNNVVETTGITADGDKALNCQYAPGQYIILPRNTNGVPNTSLTITPPFSIETWVKVGTTASRLGCIVSEGQVQLNSGGPNPTNQFYGGSGGPTWAGFELGQYANTFFFNVYNTNAYNTKANELDSPANLTVGQWVHLVVTFDGSTKSMYENGVLVGSKVAAANAAGLTYVPDPTSPLMIGSGGEPSITYGVSFAGTLDEVAIYPEVLPQASIIAHYQTAGGTNATYGANYSSAVLADNPMIYFRMDDTQSQTNAGYPSANFPVANNYGTAGAAANGVYQPGTSPGAAGPGYAGFGPNSTSVAINGWLGAVDVGSSNIPASLNPTGTTPLTIVSWFQGGPADSPGRFQEIVGHSDSSYRLSMGTTGGGNQFNPGPGPELLFSSPADVATNGFALNDGQWHMIAGVSDGTNDYMYLDGLLAKTNHNAAGINIVGTTRDLLLGGDPQYTTANISSANTIRNFDGQVAQVAFWTNALSPGQIQQLFSAAGVPITIVTQPKSATFNSGQTATLAVIARGSMPGYQWYSTNINTSAIQGIAGQTNASLVFNPATTNNSGFYFVVVSNIANSVTSSVAQLTIVGPPVIAQASPNNIQVFAGTTPTLQVTIIGPSPAYQWYSNNVAIAGANQAGYTLTTNSTSSIGSSVYTCIVTNTSGSVTDTVTVAVLADPTAPYPAQVLKDKPANYFRLDEADTGYPNNGVIGYDYAGGENGTYSNTALGQVSYSTVTDPTETSAAFGNGSSANSYLGNVPAYLNFAAPAGSNAEFSVEAWVTASFGQLYDAGIVAIGYGFGGEQFAIDTGANDASTTVPHSLRFYVNSAAGKNYGISTTYVLGNNPGWHHIVAVCDEAAGFIYLYIDGVRQGSTAIPAGSGLQGETAPLAIGARLATASSTAYDNQFFGNIDDVALYNYPLSQAQVQSHYLSSGIAPVITGLTPSSNVTTNQAATFAFTVTAIGTAPLTYQWLDNNGSTIPWATGPTLILTNVQPSQAGTYTVNVANLYGGPVSTNANLTITQLPQILSDITPANLATYATTPVTLSVVVSGTPPLSYQWFQNGSPILNATNTTYSFAALLGTNTYYLSVTNIYSAGSPTVSSTATIVGMPSTSLNPANYTDNLKITFTGYNRGQTLSDFPVLVRLSSSVTGFNYNHFALPNGGDLRFTDAGGTREIPFEIDQWNPGGESTVWVQVPSLSTTNDSIWAYWGNSTATAPLPSTNVWVPQSWEGLPAYDVVYHLKENTFPFADASGQLTSTNGVAPSPVAGIVGTGELFGGTNYLDAGTANLDDAFTLSGWVNLPATASSCQTVWANQKGGFGSAGFAFFVNYYQSTNQALLLDTGNGVNGSEISTATGLVTYGQWHQVTAAINRTNGTAALYVDGLPAAIVSGGAPRNDFVSNADLDLGRFTNSSLYFSGTMDEARIHGGVESSNWVWASWMTVQQNSSLQKYSPVSSTATNAPTPVAIQVQFSGTTLTLSGTGGTPSGTFYVVGSTNLLTPMPLWTPVSTNAFDSGGNFNVSLRVNVTKPTQFLRIKE